MASKSLAFLASLLALATASPCKPADPPNYTLPQIPNGANLPDPTSGLKVLKIAIGHGIQNYTCNVATGSAAATGALAVLYDITDLYPGTPGTGLEQSAWDGLSNSVLFGVDIPLNLQFANASSPGSGNSLNVLAEGDYGAVVADPFPAPVDLSLPGVLKKPASVLGHHFFDASGTPTFDLFAASLFGSVGKTGDISAPSGASTGILSTGAVDWLQLTAKNGKSVGVELVYRVITAGGSSELCSVLGVGAGSVPYTAFYWFYG